MIRFSRRMSRLEQAVRFLSVGAPAVVLLRHLPLRESLWQSDWQQPLNTVISPQSQALSAFAPGWASTLLLLWYVLATAWLGWKTVECLFPKVAESTHWLGRLSAGFLPGYLMIGAWHRVTGAILPNSLSPYISLLGVLAAASYMAAQRADDWLNPKTRPRFRIESLSEAFFAVFALGYALVDGVQMGGQSLVSENSARFLTYFTQLLNEPFPSAGMPWVPYAYDEFTFLYPLIQLLAGPTFPVAAFFWIIASVARLSSIGLIHFLARSAGLSSAPAFLLAAFLWLGTFSIYPLDYLLLFDTHNPLFYTLQPGRIAAVLMPLLAWQAVFAKPGHNRLPIRARQVLVGFLGAGITSLSFHAAVLACLMVVLALRIRRLDPSPALKTLGTGAALGFLFAGNLLCALVWQRTGMVTSLWLPTPAPLFPAEGPPLLLQKSPAEFLRYFALPLGLALFSLTEGPRGLRDRVPLLFALGIFLTALLAVSFLPLGIAPSYLSRLYEPPFYAFLFFALVRLFQCRSERIIIGLSLLLVLYTYPVFFASHRPTQWAENFTYLLKTRLPDNFPNLPGGGP